MATSALKSAQDEAIELGVPLVMNGDTLDTKVVMRGECVNRLIEILSREDAPQTYVNVGNHDLFNEKSTEHVLNFLRPYVRVVEAPMEVYTKNGPFRIIPYMSDPAVLSHYLSTLTKGQILVMHQGVQTAFMGHYAQDKTSLPPEAFDGFRVVGSHYHRRQNIKCGKVGLFSYIGNPYTLSFGEAQDGPKGFAVIYAPGALEFIDLDLRKHVVIDMHLHKAATFTRPNTGDLVWLKLRGPQSDLAVLEKKDLAPLVGVNDFRLDLIPDEGAAQETPKAEQPATDGEVLDNLIDATGETDVQKANLKKTWRTLLETA